MTGSGRRMACGLAAAAALLGFSEAQGVTAGTQPPGGEGKRLCISGIYPHLAVFNGDYDVATGEWRGSGGECGIGAVVPWAGKLWLLTYPPHETRGGRDKLWAIDKHLNREMRPESVGGTHAGRMVHRESNQLILGPYFIDAEGRVRAANVKTELVGRMTAVARHLKDPANLVYFFDMEGALYEVNVHTLAVNKLFEKPVPGWHGKGGYTGQRRLVLANNGESAVGRDAYRHLLVGGPARHPDEIGCLAEWDGTAWRLVERKQFLDVTGPGGLHGAPDDQAPVWAIGWDRRSCLLKLLDGGTWHTFRLPKASHCFDPAHGWYTEWPRLREVGKGQWMMDLHGMFYDFPPGFRLGHTGGLVPLASHLRYVPDFCDWDGTLVLAADDASLMANPLCGKAQSNLWFGTLDDLRAFGPRAGWGGPWVGDAVKAGEPSEPFLLGGFEQRCLHLATTTGRPAAAPLGAGVAFALEVDRLGDGQWQPYRTVSVPPSGYAWHVFPPDFEAAWVRLKADRECVATAYFHGASPRPARPAEDAIFASLAKAGGPAPLCAGLIRPAAHNTTLQFLAQTVDAEGKVSDAGYFEVDETLTFRRVEPGRADEVRQVAAVKHDFAVDDASVILTWRGQRYRLPKGDAAFDQPFPTGWPRGIRECVSERNLASLHGTLYELPRDTGVPDIKPVCTHNRRIVDFCTWRGLMVISGTRLDAPADGHCFASTDGRVGLWFGHIDDLWRLGKPVGMGGPWRRSRVQAGLPSDPYLMTNYDRKRIELSHDAQGPVAFTLEADVAHRGWHPYATLPVPAGQTVTHQFPAGYAAHWVRVKADRDCTATALFLYE